MKLWRCLPLLLAGGCADAIMQSETSARLDGARGMLGQLVVTANAAAPDRNVVHLSHTCSLKIDGTAFPVVDILEVERAPAGRKVNSILVFTPARTLLHRFEYTTERPLSCLGNRLYLAGDLAIPGGATGNELTFAPTSLSARHVDEMPGIMK